MSIKVICPTRDRPDSAWEVLQSLEQTRALGNTSVVFAIEEDQMDAYAVPRGEMVLPLLVVEGGNMVKALNEGAMEALAQPHPPTMIGFIGDDHRFRTKGWDRLFLEKAGEVGPAMMYAYDGARTDIPTECFITSDIVRALGWMSPPDLIHLYVDNSWKELGDAADVLYFFKDVLIEHMHPFYGKAPMDAGYQRVNQETMYSKDRESFTAWRTDPRFDADVRTIVRLVENRS